MYDGSIRIDTKIEDNNVKNELRALQREMKAVSNEMKRAHMEAMLPFKKEMMGTQIEMKKLQMGMELATLQAMMPFKKQAMETKLEMFKLAQSMGNYSGTTKEFMGEVDALGKQYKKANDEMIKANKMLGMSIIQTAGQMMNMTTQAQRISENYDRMANPMYKVNKAGLAVADSLNKIANNGDASVLALKMLGPNANMKQLNDMVMMINQGLMRFQIVGMAAVATAGAFYSKMFEAALGPDPSEIRAQQNELTQVYKDALQERASEIANFASLFEKVTLESVSKKSLSDALSSQVDVLKKWTTNLGELAKRGLDEGLLKELQRIGPDGAAQVAALNSMTDSELQNYVKLWQEKMQLATQQATTELEGLRQQTEAKIRELEDSLTPLGLAWEAMKGNLVTAIQPMVDLFGQLMTPVVNFVSKMAEMITSFNESHPIIAKFISGILLLVPALTLILSPLSIGIGLWGGMQAAFSSIWMLIGPLVTGLAAMSGTVWIVAGAITALTAGLIYLWNNHEGFREAVMSAWEAIKNAVVSAIDFITPYLQQAYEVIVTYIQEKLAQIRQFWEENSQQILQAAQNVWSFITNLITDNMGTISTIIDVAMKVVLAVVEYVWNAIKSIIDGAISFITGIIEVFTGLLTGDFTLMWEGIKSIFSGAIDMIVGWMSLTFVGGIRTLLTNLSKTAINLIKTKWTTIVNTFKTFGTNAINSAKSMVDSVVNFFKNLLSQAQSIFGTLRTFGASTWEALKTVIINAASTIYNTAKQKFVDLFNAIKTTLSNLKTTVSDVAQSIVNFFRNINLSSIGKSIVQGLINGIKSMKDSVFKAISSLIPSKLKTAASGLMSSLGLNGYAKGGIITKPEIAWIGEGGDTEAVIPWNNSQRSKDLWYRTGQALGMFDDGTLANTTKSINAAASKLTGTVSYPTAVTASTGGNNGNSGNVTVTSDTSIADVILDGEKVGRVVAKTVSKVQYNRATLNAAMKGMIL